MEEVCGRENCKQALKRVKANKGSAGVDGMTVQQLPDFLKQHWPAIREQLLSGTYKPQPVRRVEIPKPDGGVRKLGIPTVLDRFVQQAVMQVLQGRWDRTFSEHSYGFRPGRSAHQAVDAAQQYMAAGYRWVVDLDLEKFFDRVNHDKLMMRVARRVQDSRVLRLIRSYLEAGVMKDGVCVRRDDGTPQGGPLSPLLANIMLDDLDRFLEKRGHRFCRYADDCNVYVRSKRAGERVKEAMTRFLTTELSLGVNQAKSGVDEARKRTFLGYSFYTGSKLRIASKSIKRFKRKVRELTKRNMSISLSKRLAMVSQYARGWMSYFRLTETPSVLRELDGWIRHRVRACIWKTWFRIRTRVRNLRAFGLDERLVRRVANTSRGAWWVTGTSTLSRLLSVQWLTEQGLVSLHDRWQHLQRAL
jgi:RNA-directed DNA polymerase